MTWGKLFGSTSFNWYGGAMCLVVVATAGFAAGKPDVLANLISLCAVGVMLHAALIALNLHTSQFESRIIQRGGMGWLAIILVFMFMPAFSYGDQKPVHWWGMEISHALFWLDTALLFAACATFAAWRVVCNALQVRTRPWAWPAFACLLAVYLAGFASGDNSLWLIGLFVSVAMTYAALFTEPNTLLRWRKLRLLQQRGDSRGWLEHLPVWPTTLALSFTFALMLLRDACILLFFSFAPNGKRAVGAAMLYLLVLNMLLPFLAEVAGLDALRFFFLPFEAAYDSWSSVPVMAAHAAIALWFVRWRLRKVEAT